MTDAASTQERPIAVQIGFNKCATLSLTRLFNRSGVNSLHCNWSKGKGRQEKPLYQARIHRNLKAGRPAFEGLERFSSFFDPEFDLDPAYWEHAHKTSDKSWVQQKKDRWSNFDFERFGT
ncbi:hypothetical protein [Leisingera sp. ANG59]|uniref:hypothetical protein n=1 Tax=Leisingera sp. ANG59 TaxID=2675221 RepID=UPI0015729D9B|nr:hypothetical protein [Leisingera sp. ANG59]NSY39534.1 hypothetical protein [Leisingera sp. ANG59]